MFQNRLFVDYYEIIEKIGEGAYGSVYKIRCKKTNELFACKKIIITNHENIRYCNFNELVAYKKFNHKNIVKMYDICFEKTTSKFIYFIITELCECSLSSLIFEKRTVLTDSEIISYLDQILSGLEYLYSQGYVHNDLSLGNILCVNGEIRISDFGFMYNRFTEREFYHRNTMYIQPPELIAGLDLNCDVEKIDTWALGPIVFSLAYNEILLRHETEIDYYMDLITKTKCPSLKIITKLELDKVYLKIYNDFKKTTHKSLTQPMLQELREHHESTNPFIDRFRNKNSLNRYIKKHINWNAHTRPNINKSRELFYSLLIGTKIPSIIPLLPKKMTFKEYSFNSLWYKLQSHINLFTDNNFFTIGFHDKILLQVKHQCDIIGKTMQIMGKLFNTYLIDKNKSILLSRIFYTPKLTGRSANFLNRMENNFDRFYSLTGVMCLHKDYMGEFLFYEDSVYMYDYAEFQYYVIELLNKKIPLIDSYDLFKMYSIDYLARNRFKFLYYLSTSSVRLTAEPSQTIFEAIMLLITANDNYIINKKLVNQFLKLNVAIKINKLHENYVGNIDCVSFIDTGNTYRTHIEYFTIETVIISYYLVRLLAGIGYKNYVKCSTYFTVGKKFIQYINNMVTIID